MRKIAFIVCIVLMFSACNNTKSNKAENETNNVRKTEQKEVSASLKEVTLSFKPKIRKQSQWQSQLQ